MNNIEIRKDTGVRAPVFISGLTRSGKVLLSLTIPSFENVEKIHVDFFLEQMPPLNYMNKISDEVAAYLLQAGLNIRVYDDAIGRNSNFRPNDFTSVWKYKDPQNYVKRLFAPEGDEVFQGIEEKKTLYPMMIHNGLWHSKVFFKAFPDMKMFHMQRNPIEIAYSWMMKKYGREFYSNKRSSTLTFNYKNETLPYYAYGWEDEYLSLIDVDRIVMMLFKIRSFHRETFNSLSESQKNQIYFVNHERLATKPNEVLPGVLTFLGTEQSEHTERILKEADCPRVINPKDREDKLTKLKENLSIEKYELLLEMSDVFEINEDTI